jgi:hypothetical protein
MTGPFWRQLNAALHLALHLAHVLIGEPVSTPDQVGGRLSPEHALVGGIGIFGASRKSNPYAGMNRIRFEGFPRCLALTLRPSGFSAPWRGSPWNLHMM